MGIVKIRFSNNFLAKSLLLPEIEHIRFPYWQYENTMCSMHNHTSTFYKIHNVLFFGLMNLVKKIYKNPKSNTVKAQNLKCMSHELFYFNM